jgi:NDP-sugar pyrophosphorylase family protein
MNPSSSDRVRITISLSRELAGRIDDLVDGVKIRNRSHAIESLVNDSLDLAHIHQAVILLGGEQAIKRVPAIKRMLGTLAQYGIFEAIIAVGYLGEEIRKLLGNGSEYGVQVTYVESDLGTGGALLQMKNRLKGTFLVVNIENPVEINLKNLLKFHREHTPVATIATRSLRELSGVYVMETKVFNFIPQGFCMLEDTVFHEMTKEGKLLPYPILTERTDKS